MNLYDRTTFGCSRLITQEYSTSFTLGIRTLAPKFRLPVYAVYGFVRYADEIVDTFHGFDKKRLLADFRTDTYRAIDEGISLNPVLHSFQLVVNRYGIDRDLIEAFLHSMEMDLTETRYAPDGYQEYIYGSAEVVGLMCLRIFCEGDGALYDRLKADARKLGAAFQKVNFLRDLKADYDERGRTYFPGVNFNTFTEGDKKAIEADIQQDFDDALRGIRQLPRAARLGVYLAYRYYLRLFDKIKALPPSRIREARVRVPDAQKLLLLAQTYCLHQLRFRV
jgi:phytoene/squalene synthetase